MRDEWLRRIRDAGDAEVAAQLRYDGKPLEPLELEAVRVICGRLSWASLHWGDAPHPDAILALGVAFVRAGWRPPEACGATPPNVRGPVSCHLPRGHAGEHYSTSGCAGSEIRWATEAKTIPARATDPATSHAATKTIRLRAGTQRARLLEAFALEAAGFGLTDEEAADLADGVPYRSEFAKRCSELREAGWIETTGTTRKGVAGHDRIVSKITDAGRAALAIARRGGVLDDGDG